MRSPRPAERVFGEQVQHGRNQQSTIDRTTRGNDREDSQEKARTNTLASAQGNGYVFSLGSGQGLVNS